jgi:GNAT superfamily N-acetyltransferase
LTSLAHRIAEPTDAPLIADSWASSWSEADAAGTLPIDLYWEVARKGVARHLERAGVEAIVAFHPGEDVGHELYGWLVIERGCYERRRVRDGRVWVDRNVPMGVVVHYLYVKERYRRIGVARYLFRAAGIDLGSDFVFTHKTALGGQLARRLAPHARWRPRLVRYRKNVIQEATSEGQAIQAEPRADVRPPGPPGADRDDRQR